MTKFGFLTLTIKFFKISNVLLLITVLPKADRTYIEIVGKV